MMKLANTLEKKKHSWTWQKVLFIVSFIAIPIASFLIFYVYVNFNSFVMAFQRPDKYGSLYFTFDNFKWVFERIANGSTNEVDDLQKAFLNTFLTFGVQFVMFFVGLFVSYFLYKKIKGYQAFRIIFYLPTIISSVVTSFFYIELMNSNFVPQIFQTLFHLDYELKSPLADSSFSNGMIMLNMIWLSFPSNMILWGGALSRIPTSVLESARLDGCGWLRELFRIILPMVWPTMVVLMTSNLAGIFGATGQVFLLTQGAYGTQTVSNWMYMMVQRANTPDSLLLFRAAALGLCLTSVSIVLALAVRAFLNSRQEEVQY